MRASPQNEEKVAGLDEEEEYNLVEVSTLTEVCQRAICVESHINHDDVESSDAKHGVVE